ncbi:MAG: hypothetical protein KGY67_06285 [Candidatus Thermoplasmatota archaeon]|nr:hypothetical protein [Candidatus Thermoplasmatota archaeon]
MKQEKSWFSRSKKCSDDAFEIKKNVSEMQTWMRNLEQQVSSVGARLGAVENRLSHAANTNLYESKDDESVMYSTSSVETVHASINTQVRSLEKQMQSLTQSFSKINHQVQRLDEFKKNSKKKESQLNNQIRPQSFIMKIGKKEIPLELTGIIGGLVTFIVAGLVVFNASNIVLNPWFLMGIGSLFITSSVLRTNKGNIFLKKMTGGLFSKSAESQIHHSDSPS